MIRTPSTFTLDVNTPSVRNGANHMLAEIKKKTLRSRILTALFGTQHEVIIIMPSCNVKNLTFTRNSEESTLINSVQKEEITHEADADY